MFFSHGHYLPQYLNIDDLQLSFSKEFRLSSVLVTFVSFCLFFFRFPCCTLTVERRQDFELGLKKRMSVGDLLTMHKEAKTYSEKTIVQVVEKHNKDNGRLKSLSLSAGNYVSHNVIPMNDAAAEGMNEFRKFELMEINLAHIKKDSLIFEDIDQLRLLDSIAVPVFAVWLNLTNTETAATAPLNLLQNL